MKRIIILVLTLVLLSGCSLKGSSLDDATIYTTIYPTEYIMNYLYGDNSTVESIYPIGVDLDTYKLTKKQIDKYASGDLFVFVGLGNEKNIAKSFINNNKKLLIIDATRGLSSDNIEELWLAPNNFLMLSKNIKNSLNEYLNNTVKEAEVNDKYNELYKEVSWIDAELRNIANDAKENSKNTIVISNNVLKFLSGYGFNIISLEDIVKSGSENALNDLKNKFKNSTYTNILKLSSDKDSEVLTELKEKYNANIVSVNDLITNDDSASDYVSIQYENISLIRDIVEK